MKCLLFSWNLSSRVTKLFTQSSQKNDFDRDFIALQEEDILDINIEIVCLDSTVVKVQPDACRALKKKKTDNRTFKRRTYYKNPLLNASPRATINFSLLSGSANDSRNK